MHNSLYTWLAFAGALLCLTSCGTDEQNQATERADGHKRLEEVQEEHQRRRGSSARDTTSFETAFSLFLKALHASDTATINQFIHPDHGVWIIEQPGAMPRMTHVTDIRHVKREYQDRSFFTVQDEVKNCDLREEPWPAFDCADMDYDKGQSGYSKDGCFVWQSDKFQKSAYWDYSSLTDTDIERIVTALPLLQKSVLHTPTSFEFHFGHVDRHWRLLFVKLIYPCSA
jgi:hypothetical protein